MVIESIAIEVDRSVIVKGSPWRSAKDLTTSSNPLENPLDPVDETPDDGVVKHLTNVRRKGVSNQNEDFEDDAEEVDDPKDDVGEEASDFTKAIGVRVVLRLKYIGTLTDDNVDLVGKVIRPVDSDEGSADYKRDKKRERDKREEKHKNEVHIRSRDRLRPTP